MSSELRSLAIGLVMFVVGLVVWLTMSDVQTPIISLRIVGIVLMVLGALEVVVTLGFNAWRALRRSA